MRTHGTAPDPTHALATRDPLAMPAAMAWQFRSVWSDPMLPDAQKLVRELAGDTANPELTTLVRDIAEVQIELVRVPKAGMSCWQRLNRSKKVTHQRKCSQQNLI